jgi:hypothetical protein
MSDTKRYALGTGLTAEAEALVSYNFPYIKVTLAGLDSENRPFYLTLGAPEVMVLAELFGSVIQENTENAKLCAEREKAEMASW